MSSYPETYRLLMNLTNSPRLATMILTNLKEQLIDTNIMDKNVTSAAQQRFQEITLAPIVDQILNKIKIKNKVQSMKIATTFYSEYRKQGEGFVTKGGVSDSSLVSGLSGVVSTLVSEYLKTFGLDSTSATFAGVGVAFAIVTGVEKTAQYFTGDKNFSLEPSVRGGAAAYLNENYVFPAVLPVVKKYVDMLPAGTITITDTQLQTVVKLGTGNITTKILNTTFGSN